MRLPRFTILQMLLAAALAALLMGFITSWWRAAGRWEVGELSFSPSGKYLAAKYTSGEIDLWDVASDRPRRVATFAASKRRGNIVSKLRFLDDDMLAQLENDSPTGRFNGVVRIFELESEKVREPFAIAGLQYLDFVPASGQIGVIRQGGSAIDFYNVESGLVEQSQSLPTPLLPFVASPDGQWLAASRRHEPIQVVNLRSGQHHIITDVAADAAVAGIAADRMVIIDSYLASPHERVGKITYVDLANAQQAHAIQPLLSELRMVALSSDGTRLIVADERECEYYDVNNLTLLNRLHVEGSAFRALAIAPDGKTLASSSDRQLALYDLSTGQLRSTLTVSHWRTSVVLFVIGIGILAALWIVALRRGKRSHLPPAATKSAAQAMNSAAQISE